MARRNRPNSSQVQKVRLSGSENRSLVRFRENAQEIRTSDLAERVGPSPRTAHFVRRFDETTRSHSPSLAKPSRRSCERSERSADGEERRIRTHGRVSPTHESQTGSFNRGQRFWRPLHNRRTSAATQHRHSGSIYEVGARFQSFGINDFAMVDLTGIEPVTS